MEFSKLEDILKIDNLAIRALELAIFVHDGEFRKINKDIPYVIHVIEVSRILETVKREGYKYSKYLQAASSLHDYPENSKKDTKDVLEFIEKYFGPIVRVMVDYVTEDIDDKTKKELSWESRKEKAIAKLKMLNDDYIEYGEYTDLVNEYKQEIKWLAMADRIANLTNIKNDMKTMGDDVFSHFRRGKEQQEWYYRNVYFALVENEDPDFILCRMLRENINEVFGRTMEEYLSEQKAKQKIIKI